MIFKNGTAARIKFLLVSSTDHISPVIGATPTGLVCKEGGSFVTAAGTFAGLGLGWYVYTATTGETNTNGSLLLHATAATADPADVESQIAAVDLNDAVRFGLSALPNAAAGANGGLPLGDASGDVTLTTTSTTALVSATAAASATATATAILASPANKLVTDGSGRVTVGTNADKTGYSLTQGFPTNFATMLIDGSGKITVGTNSDKTGYALTQTFPPNFSILSIAPSTGYVTATNGGGGSGLTLDSTLAGHTTAGTVGGALSLIDVAVSTRASASVIPGNFNLMAIDANGLLGLTPAQHTAIQADSTAALTAQGYTSARAPLLDRLDAAISSRVATGALPTNFSALSIDSSGNVSLPAAMQAAISATVWDVLTASHTANGSFGKLLESYAGNPVPPTLAQIVNGIWDELTAGHTVTGSFAALLATIKTLAQSSVNFGAPPSASTIATAVAAAILANPANLLVTDAEGAVAVNNFVSGLLDLVDGVETGITVRETLRAELASLAGVVSGAGTNSISLFAGGDPTTLRISATVDTQGNRPAVTLHLGG